MISLRNRPKTRKPESLLRRPVKSRKPEPLLRRPSKPQPEQNTPVDLAPIQSAPEPEPTKPKLSLSTLNTAQNAALAALPAGAAAAVSTVWDAMEGSQASQTQFLALLTDGTLAHSDGEQTVVEGLRDLSVGRARGMDGAVLTRETIALIADPNVYVNQGTSFTCGATNLQRQLADNPATLVSLVEDLSDRNGNASFEAGFSFQRHDGSVAEDGSGRNLTNRLLQGALMSVAGSPAHGEYDPQADQFADGGKGLQLLEIARTTALAEGNKQGVLIHDKDSTVALRKLVAELPEGETFQAAMGWNGRDHMLLVTGHKDGEIQYFNPDPTEPRTGSMPVHDFLFKTQAVVLSGDQLEGMDLTPEAGVYWPEG